MLILADVSEQVVPLLRKLEGLLVATRQQVMEAAASAHTAALDAQNRAEAFNKAQADNVNELKAKIDDLTSKIATGDEPDDLVAQLQDIKAVSDRIDVAPLDPGPAPDPTPTPTPEPAPTPTPVPDQPTPAPDQPVQPVPDPGPGHDDPANQPVNTGPAG